MIRAVQAGESRVVLSISQDDPAACAAMVRKAYLRLSLRHDPSIASLRPTVDSIVIETIGELDLDSCIRDIELELQKDALVEDSANILRVPLCYDPELGFDLASLSQKTGMQQSEIIELHSCRTYRVWMLGFMPGFPYMGQLDERLVIARKERPSPRIPAGSVAVAEEYTGVYPFDSPGGWHVVGRIPWVVTDYGRTPPWLFDYGMNVQFYPITIETYRKNISDLSRS